jgi:formamidopyrimidine-DNA glycosylase
MPELPEVETIRRGLAPQLLGQEVVRVWRSSQALRGERPLRKRLGQALLLARIQDLQRRGKYLLLCTPQGGALIHLGMSGQLTVAARGADVRKHTHVRMEIGSGLEIRYVDPRRFGLFRPFLGKCLPREWQNLGPDPLDGHFTVDTLHAALVTTLRAVKVALLDQSLVAGLGNIYVSEALFLARVHPWASAGTLAERTVAALHEAIVRVLLQGLQNGGTSLNDYVDANGARGGNQDHLWVYGRADRPCRLCGRTIQCALLGARSTYWCPRCQGTKPAHRAP